MGKRWIDPDSDLILSALYAALNVEGCALAGGRLGAHEGLDVAWHFAKVREAIKAREDELEQMEAGQ